jgi:hypothetical protein
MFLIISTLLPLLPGFRGGCVSHKITVAIGQYGSFWDNQINQECQNNQMIISLYLMNYVLSLF